MKIIQKILLLLGIVAFSAIIYSTFSAGAQPLPDKLFAGEIHYSRIPV